MDRNYSFSDIDEFYGGGGRSFGVDFDGNRRRRVINPRKELKSHDGFSYPRPSPQPPPPQHVTFKPERISAGHKQVDNDLDVYHYRPQGSVNFHHYNHPETERYDRFVVVPTYDNEHCQKEISARDGYHEWDHVDKYFDLPDRSDMVPPRGNKHPETGHYNRHVEVPTYSNEDHQKAMDRYKWGSMDDYYDLPHPETIHRTRPKIKNEYDVVDTLTHLRRDPLQKLQLPQSMVGQTIHRTRPKIKHEYHVVDSLTDIPRDPLQKLRLPQSMVGQAGFSHGDGGHGGIGHEEFSTRHKHFGRDLDVYYDRPQKSDNFHPYHDSESSYELDSSYDSFDPISQQFVDAEEFSTRHKHFGRDLDVYHDGPQRSVDFHPYNHREGIKTIQPQNKNHYVVTPSTGMNPRTSPHQSSFQYVQSGMAEEIYKSVTADKKSDVKKKPPTVAKESIVVKPTVAKQNDGVKNVQPVVAEQKTVVKNEETTVTEQSTDKNEQVKMVLSEEQIMTIFKRFEAIKGGKKVIHKKDLNKAFYHFGFFFPYYGPIDITNANKDGFFKLKDVDALVNHAVKHKYTIV